MTQDLKEGFFHIIFNEGPGGAIWLSKGHKFNRTHIKNKEISKTHEYGSQYWMALLGEINFISHRT
jgi:hypothetical protein